MSTAESGTAGTEAQRAKQDRAAEDSAPRAQPRVEPRSSPYFGLDYYDERFSAWFFGRQAEIDMVITNLQAARLTLLHASSGVGKSSLLRAGVAAGLLQARESDPEVEVPLVFSSWSANPVIDVIEALERTIRPLLSAGEECELPRTSLCEAIVAASSFVGSNLLLILDQFEEYALYSAGEQPPERFAHEFAECVGRSQLPANFLISIREDAYASLGGMFSGRIPNVYSNYLTVDYLSRKAAADAIRRPLLEVYNRQPGVEPVEIEPELVDAVIDAVTGENDTGKRQVATGAHRVGGVPTPLLQLVMETIWERERARRSRTLRLATLSELHGVERIVDAHLENALSKLSPDQRETALDVFDRLVTESGGKIAQAVPELAFRTTHGEDEVGEVLANLDKARIVRPVAAAPGQDPVRDRRYEIFHDVLGPAINRVVQVHTEARLRRQRNAARRRAALVGTLALAAIAFGIFALVARQNALDEKRVALASALAAQSNRLLTSDVPLATLLGVAATRVDPTESTRAALTEALEQPLHAVIHESASVQGVVFAASAHLLATANRDGKVVVWDASTYQPVGRPMFTGATIYGLSLSPNGKLLATGDRNGNVDVWNVAKDERVAQLQAGGGSVNAIAFSADGRLLAAGGQGGVVAIWRVPDYKRARLRLSVGSEIMSIAFAPSSHTLTSGDANGRIRFWSTSTGRSARPALSTETAITALAYNRDGTMLAGADQVSGEVGGDVWVWTLAGGQPVKEGTNKTEVTSLGFGASPTGASAGDEMLAGGDAGGYVLLWGQLTRATEPLLFDDGSEVASVAFSPDRGTIASADNAGNVVIWSVVPPIRVGSPLAGGTARSVAFSPDGALLAAPGPHEEGVILWNPRTGHEEGLLRGVREVQSLAFNRSGKLLAAGTPSGEVAVWNVRSRKLLYSPLHDHGAVETVAFSPARDELLATGVQGEEGAGAHNIALWNALTGRQDGPSLPETSSVTSVAFSPNGTLLASGDIAREIRVWRVDSRSAVGARMVASGTISSVAFSQDGKLIASGDAGYKILVWAAATHAEVNAFADESKVTSVAFSPSESLLAAADERGYIVLVDPRSGVRVGRIPPSKLNTLLSVAFDPRESVLAGGDEAGNVTLYRWRKGMGSSSVLARTACAEVRANLTRSQWRQYVPGEGYEKLCSGYP